MNIRFFGAAHEVTGSCALITVQNKNILIDCGMEQGADLYENCELPIAPAEIDCICLTHAHIDHSGKLPALVAMGYRGAIHATEATRRLCDIMLRDSAYIQEYEAEWRNKKAKRKGDALYVPLYTVKDAVRTMKQFVPHDYHEEFVLTDGVTVSFSDAGHLLGSASIRVTLTEDGVTKTLLFSGDLGNIRRPLLRDPAPAPKADYVVIESTYGDRLHGARPDYESQLVTIMRECFARGGSLVIPAFAIGRTQELLYLIRGIKEKHLLPEFEGFPVFVDSPLAVEATNIYGGDLKDYYDAETLALLSKGVNPILFEDLRLSVTPEESRAINTTKGPKVIISASGMCEAGRIRHHLKHNLWKPENTILFVGYQSEGTVGRLLVEGRKRVRLFGEEIRVRAKIRTLAGISGHADRDMLLSWLRSSGKPEAVFVNHGEDGVCDSFAATVTERLGVPAVAPYNGDSFDLETGEKTLTGNTERIPRKASKPPKSKGKSAYDRLLRTGRRLEHLIDVADRLSNKEIARLTDQLIAICEKYER